MTKVWSEVRKSLVILLTAWVVGLSIAYTIELVTHQKLVPLPEALLWITAGLCTGFVLQDFVLPWIIRRFSR